MVLLILHWLPSLVFLAGCSNWVLGGILLVKTELDENGKLRPMATGIKVNIIRMLNTRVPLASCIGLVMFAFLLGLGVNDYYREKTHNTFHAGYQARDVEAYSSLHLFNQGFTVFNVNSPKSFDLLDDNGQLTKGVVFCYPMTELGKGSKISPGMQAYYRGCLSFDGPKAYIQIEPKNKEFIQVSER